MGTLLDRFRAFNDSRNIKFSFIEDMPKLVVHFQSIPLPDLFVFNLFDMLITLLVAMMREVEINEISLNQFDRSFPLKTKHCFAMVEFQSLYSSSQ